MGFHWRFFIFNGDYSFYLTIIIIGFQWQLWVFNGYYEFDIVLVHSCTFDTFFHYRSIRI